MIDLVALKLDLNRGQINHWGSKSKMFWRNKIRAKYLGPWRNEARRVFGIISFAKRWRVIGILKCRIKLCTVDRSIRVYKTRWYWTLRCSYGSKRPYCTSIFSPKRILEIFTWKHLGAYWSISEWTSWNDEKNQKVDSLRQPLNKLFRSIHWPFYDFR